MPAGCQAVPGECGAVPGGCGAVLRGAWELQAVPGVLCPLWMVRGRLVLQSDPGAPLSPGSTEPSPGAGAEPGGASTEPGGAGARLAWRVGFPAVLVMNLHEPSVSTRRQSMAESTGVNKCLYNEGRGELAAAPAASPGAGGQRLINAECPPCPPGSRSARRACLPIRGMLRGCSIHPLCRGCSRCSMPRAASSPAGSWGLPHDPPVLLPTWEPG